MEEMQRSLLISLADQVEVGSETSEHQLSLALQAMDFIRRLDEGYLAHWNVLDACNAYTGLHLCIEATYLDLTEKQLPANPKLLSSERTLRDYLKEIIRLRVPERF